MRIVFCILAFGVLIQTCRSAEPIRAGIIGLDTSHAVAFTKILNDPKATGDLADVVVVAAFPGGSPEVPRSCQLLKTCVPKVQQMGVEIVDSIDELLKKVDVVLLQSLDGRVHLEQVKPVLAAGKPVFIDKPMTASLADAVEIFRLAKQHNVPCFSASSLRYSSGIYRMRDDPRIGRVVGCDAYSPNKPLCPSHPDLFYYGIHGAETLLTIMGPGCKSVTNISTEGTTMVVGTWQDGRVGTLRGIRRGRGGFGAMVFGTKGIAPSGTWEGYEPLIIEIAKFFKTVKPPVSAEETLEIIAFIEAANRSKRQGGKAVSLESVLKEARE